MKNTFLIVLSFFCLNVHGQKVGVGTTAPAAKLDVRGSSDGPSIPGLNSTGILRIGVSAIEGIDIGKMSASPFSAWWQSGFNGNTVDPLSLQPSGGSVGIGIIGPEISAALDINSTTKGFLPPRMTSADRNTIVSPAAGLMIWCTNCGTSGEVQVYNGSSWTNMIGMPAAVAIGDIYGGGIVAYILQPGDPGYIQGQIHGLIAAPFDQSNGSTWGCPDIYIQGAEPELIGCGLNNTIAIVNGCAEIGTAARKCYDLVLNGYSDWYLPGKEELNKLSINRVAIGGFQDGRYWSSSQYNGSDGWEQFIFSGFQCNGHKSTLDYVRAVRSF